MRTKRADAQALRGWGGVRPTCVSGHQLNNLPRKRIRARGEMRAVSDCVTKVIVEELGRVLTGC